jgi:hypothetical protein
VTLENRQHSDFVLANPVDDSICLQYDLANVISAYLGDDSPQIGKRREAINGIEYSTNPSGRRLRLVKGYEITDVKQVATRTLRPKDRCWARHSSGEPYRAFISATTLS